MERASGWDSGGSATGPVRNVMKGRSGTLPKREGGVIEIPAGCASTRTGDPFVF